MNTRTARFFAPLSLAACLTAFALTAAGCGKTQGTLEAKNPASLRADPSKMTPEGRKKMEEGFRKAGEQMRQPNSGAPQVMPPGPR